VGHHAKRIPPEEGSQFIGVTSGVGQGGKVGEAPSEPGLSALPHP
jgi:hypothetical protein